ncbi:MAG TPA: cation:proton antiporter [Anaerolineales bacterium]|nr:cation:proton antiporter [Anaerolineales bacterium]
MMSSQDFVLYALQITVMLAFALLFGQLMRRMSQPPVLGEMIGGIVLGPTVLGLLLPGAYHWLFASSANVAIVRDASIKLGMLFFLFIAGLETNLSDLKTMGRRAILIGLVGTLVPIGAGIALVYAVPREFWGPTVQTHFFAFALFIGMNLANSANPVLARILMDLGLMNGGIGTMCMTATIVDDLVNWTLFAIILGEIAPSSQIATTGLPMSIALVGLVFVLILGIGRWVGPRTLHWLKGHLSWPTGFIAVTALLVLVAASLTERLGIHAFLGAFLVGAALSGQGDEHREAHDVITRFALSFFAPIYFISIGMTTNYVTNFDGGLVAVILAVALFSKLGGVLLGARLAGMPIDRDAWAIAFGLNARGATGIILAGVGRAAGVIDDRIFVAIVVMALATSLLAGPAMKWLLSHRIAEARLLGRRVEVAAD